MKFEISDRYRPVKGWAEILFRKEPLQTRSFHGAAPKTTFIPPTTFFSRVDYEPVGSWIPTEEFVHTFDFVDYFQHCDVGELYNIPRHIAPYDAITLCPMLPPIAKTLIVIPKDHVKWYPSSHTQCSPHSDLALMSLNRSFLSFRYPAL